jgi:MFS superfamily sulfate permease-like transporter
VRSFSARDLSKKIVSLGVFLLESAVYAWFMFAYLFLVYHFDNNKLLYAILALSLISAQGFVLERMTSALLVVLRRTHAFISVLFRLFYPHETIIVPANVPGVLIYRFAGPLFFANTTHFAQRVLEIIDTADPTISFFLINAEAIVDVDTTGVEVLEELNKTFKSRNIILGLCEVKGHFREMLLNMPRQADLIVYPSVVAALQKFTKKQPEEEKNSEASDGQVHIS